MTYKGFGIGDSRIKSQIVFAHKGTFFLIDRDTSKVYEWNLSRKAWNRTKALSSEVKQKAIEADRLRAERGQADEFAIASW